MDDGAMHRSGCCGARERRDPRRWHIPLIAVLALLALPAVASAQSFTVQAVQFSVDVGPGGDVPCTVDANLYRPADATAAHPDPSILMTNPFLGTKTTDDGLASSFASLGYVVLSYSGLGWGASTCPLELDNPQYDGAAASQLVTFLGGGSSATNGETVNYVIHDPVAHNGLRYSDDPRVGMMGISYGGAAPLSAASVDPRIDTIIPIATWDDLTYSLAPNDANLPGESVTNPVPGTEKTFWDLELIGGGEALGTVDGVEDGGGLTLGGCVHFNVGVCPPGH